MFLILMHSSMVQRAQRHGFDLLVMTLLWMQPHLLSL